MSETISDNLLPWSLSREKIAEILNVNVQKGLSEEQVEKNRLTFGSNIIAESKPTTIVSLIIEGIKEPMMLLLASIAILSLLFGKFIEAFAMLFVIAAYITVELINKFRSDRIMTRLKSLTNPTAKIIRNGIVQEIETKNIVVGDILILSQGTIIPADARLLTSYGLIVNEASLTGESFPVTKQADSIFPAHTPASNQTNCIFAGTIVVDGQGSALVFAVGEKSKFGLIAYEVQKTERESTILQESMTKLAKVLAIFAFLVSILIPTLGFLRGMPYQQMILTWLSLTFLMIPGQPPIIITMALAFAAFALAQKKIIVKRLRGVEIIGQTTSVVSDKTGTITESTMVVERFVFNNEMQSNNIQENIALALPDYSNDPTDQAVLKKLGPIKKNLNQIGFQGFSDKKPWRDLIYKKNNILFHALAGNPEILIAHSTLSHEQKQEFDHIAKHEAQLGKRIVAYGLIENTQQELEELNNLRFVALAILKDPVRPGVKEAINRLKEAHVNTFIITGDYQATAQAIASEIGITGDVVIGNQFERMSDQELMEKLKTSTIFARMNPTQKLHLVKVLQQKGDIVAAIGDGINDAPALKAADVGIAMGIIGTDLAKEVSDLILTDDNYVHIPDAIAIGRRALDNFKKGLSYYLSAKFILLLIFIVPLIAGIPFPFVPIQIIIIELLMDLASSTIFVAESAEPTSMKKAFQPIKNFLNRSLILTIFKTSLPLAIGILFIFFTTYKTYNLITAQTAAFVAWLIGHILLSLNLKQRELPLFVQGFFSNHFGIFWLFAMIIFSLVITSIPFLYPYFNTTFLPLALWIKIIIIDCSSTFWIEIIKIFTRHHEE